MSLIIKQKLFAFTDTYEVQDSSGRPRYKINTEFLTIGHKIHIFDAVSGRELGKIQERVFTFLSKADLYIAGGRKLLVTREFTFFKPRYTVSNGWKIAGDFLGWDYSIENTTGKEIAEISRELFHLSDTYSLTVRDPKDELEALMIAITIDMMNCGNS